VRVELTAIGVAIRAKAILDPLHVLLLYRRNHSFYVKIIFELIYNTVSFIVRGRMTSKIYEISKENLQELTIKSSSLADILRQLGLYVSSGNYRPLKRRLDNENIDYTHIKMGLDANKGKLFPNKQLPLSEIMIENSGFSTTQLKKRLIKNNILENKCSKCGLGAQWNNENLVLQLDHINGNPRDNRLENLRMLCPNCHSQTPTYSARNSRKGIVKNPKKCACGQNISKKGTSCKSCAGINSHPTKINWPSHEELIIALRESNYTQVSKKLGVSDNALRKRLKKSFQLDNS
jgi:hypothetical protein